MQRCHRLEGSSKHLTNKLGRLMCENDQQRDVTGRLSDELRRLKDSTKIQHAAIRKLKIRQVGPQSNKQRSKDPCTSNCVKSAFHNDLTITFAG